MNEQKKIWMVRIGNHICGPYETAAVESLIQEQRISEIDEVALPCKSWAYVRDRGEFLDVLDKLKNRSFGKSSSKGSLTGTENLTNLNNIDETQELTRSRIHDTKTSPLIEFDVLELDKDALDINKIKQNRIVLKTKKRTSFNLALIAIIVILGVYSFGPKNLFSDPMGFMRGAKMKPFAVSWASGDYESAFKAFQGNKSLLSNHRNKYAALLLMRGDEFNLADKTLSLASDKSSVEWKNLKGLSEQYKGNEDSAESYFLSVLKEDQNYVPALINLGLLKRDAGEWSLARSYFESAFSKIGESGYDDVAFYLLEAWVRQSLAETGVSNLENIHSYLQNQMVGHSTYLHEFKLIELWISVTRTRWVKKEEILTKQFLDLDPQILVERKINPFTYRLQKGAISHLCDDLNLKLKATKYKKPVIALCSVINGDYDNALEVLRTERQNEYAVILSSFVARLSKKIDFADEQLVKAMEFSKGEDFTRNFFQARFCYEKGDMKCAAEYWMKGLSKDSDAYTAHTGLAKSYFEVGDYEKTAVFMNRAKGFTKSYAPLIELQILMKDAKK